MKIEEKYKLGKIICETENSVLYEARKINDFEGTDELRFVVKKYKNSNVLSVKEKNNSQLVENFAHLSVVIPVLEMYDDGSLVMQFKNSGIFLNDFISMIKEKKAVDYSELILTVIHKVLLSLYVLHNCFKGFDNRKGYIHMDIHPGNIFLENLSKETPSDFNGVSVKFLDMSNAICMDENGKAKRESEVAITPGYSAPELFDYENLYFRETTDVYSVASILAELVSICKPRNILIRCLLDRIIDIGLKTSSMYRYSSAKEMDNAIKDTIELIGAINNNDYIQTAILSYKMNIDVNTLKESAVELNDKSFKTALGELRAMQLVNRPNNDRIVYIYEYLNELYNVSKDKIYDTDCFGQFEADLIYLGLSSYNNIGATEKAFELVERFDEVKHQGKISMNDYSRIANRIAVSFYDAGDFETAAERQKKNISILERIYSVLCEVSEDSELRIDTDETTKNLGRAYSSYGRYIYSVGRRTHNSQQVNLGVDYLEKALDIFVHDIENRLITISAILHVAAEIGDKALFEKYEGEYFGSMNNGWTVQSIEHFLSGDDLTNYQNDNYDYSLLTMIKCIDAFYVNKIGPEFEEVLRRLVDQLCSRERYGYPINLIFTYLGHIIYQMNGNKVDEDVNLMYELGTTLSKSFRVDNQSMSVITIMSYQKLWNLECMKNSESDDKADVSDSKQKLLNEFIEKTKNGGTSLEKYSEYAKEYQTLGELVYFV